MDLLRKNHILVDGADEKYMLQIFMLDAMAMYGDEKAGPFFYELIQREGDRGFGYGNFRALFESIESAQRAEPVRPRGRRVDRPHAAGEVPAKPHIAFRSAGGRAAVRGMPHAARVRRRVLDPVPRGAAHDGLPHRPRDAGSLGPQAADSGRAPAAPPAAPPRREGARGLHAGPLQRGRDGFPVQAPHGGGIAGRVFERRRGRPFFLL